MTEREKIIELAKECGVVFYTQYEEQLFKIMEAFYHKAQRKAFKQSAQVCEEKWRKEDSFDSHANAKAIRQLIKE